MGNVSILMAAYNAKAFISEAIDSVIAQTYRDWELVIIDDGSTDGTADYVASAYGHLPQIKCHSLQVNGGPSAARNVGIEMARGRWLAILDSDDRFAPDRIEKLLEVGERESLDLVTDNQLYFDDSTKTVFQAALTVPGDHVRLDAALLVRNDGPPLRFSFGALKPFMRREFLMSHRLTYPVELRIGEDFVFLFRVLQRGAEAWLVADQLYIYTVPKARARAASAKTRTNYGKGNIESLMDANANLSTSLLPDSRAQDLADLIEQRYRRFSCAQALRDVKNLSMGRAIRRLAQERGWPRFVLDKARNLFQRSHTIRGAKK